LRDSGIETAAAEDVGAAPGIEVSNPSQEDVLSSEPERNT
jgi:hypothetical protein